MIQIKRVYEKVSKTDGHRVLVDRLWPRGIKKEELDYDDWQKELAPSAEIRKKFNHDPKKWKEFKKEFLKELRLTTSKKIIDDLIELAKKKNLTLLYSAKDEVHNNAIILKEVLERKLKKD